MYNPPKWLLSNMFWVRKRKASRRLFFFTPQKIESSNFRGFTVFEGKIIISYLPILTIHSGSFKSQVQNAPCIKTLIVSQKHRT